MKKEFKIAVRKDSQSQTEFDIIMKDIFPKFYKKHITFMKDENVSKLPFEKLVGARIRPLTVMTLIRTIRIGFLLEEEWYDIVIGLDSNYSIDNTDIYDLYTFRFYGKDRTEYMNKVLNMIRIGTNSYPTSCSYRVRL